MALLFMAWPWPLPRPQGQTLRLRQRSMGKGRVLPNIVQLLRQSWCICSSWLLSKGLYLASLSLPLSDDRVFRPKAELGSPYFAWRNAFRPFCRSR